MADERPTWTIRGLLDWTVNFLKSKGIESAGLEARILLAHALRCKQIELFTRADEVPDEDGRARFRELVRRRVERCPVAYLVGVKEFYKLEFEVTPAVLIPRPETELLVMECLRLLPKDRPAKVLDLGTGSGAIAVSVAQQRPLAEATATDLSPDALAVARRNAERHKLAGRIRFLEGDLFDAVPAGERFDFLLSNPPYIAAAELPSLAPEVRDHEPRLAVDGGPSGLAVYERIAARAGEFLQPGGHLLLEIAATQGEAVRGLLEARGGFAVGPTLTDGAGLPRVVVARAAVSG
jgi:release factor glutamine methyltransferase